MAFPYATTPLISKTQSFLNIAQYKTGEQYKLLSTRLEYLSLSEMTETEILFKKCFALSKNLNLS